MCPAACVLLAVVRFSLAKKIIIKASPERPQLSTHLRFPFLQECFPCCFPKREFLVNYDEEQYGGGCCTGRSKQKAWSPLVREAAGVEYFWGEKGGVALSNPHQSNRLRFGGLVCVCVNLCVKEALHRLRP